MRPLQHGSTALVAGIQTTSAVSVVEQQPKVWRRWLSDIGDSGATLIKREPKFSADMVVPPIGTNRTGLRALIDSICTAKIFRFDTEEWMAKEYKPTPTIVEAAETLYRTHAGAKISKGIRSR